MRFLIVWDGTIVEGKTYTDIVTALGRRRRFGGPASALEAMELLATGIQRLTGSRVEPKGPDLEAQCESVVTQAEAAGLLQAKAPDDAKPEEYFHCGNCDWSTTNEEDLDTITDFWGRIAPGEIVPSGQCPECRALAYRGNADETPCSTYEDLRTVLGDLLEWGASMGGWVAEPWKRAGQLFAGARRNKQ